LPQNICFWFNRKLQFLTGASNGPANCSKATITDTGYPEIPNTGVWIVIFDKEGTQPYFNFPLSLFIPVNPHIQNVHIYKNLEVSLKIWILTRVSYIVLGVGFPKYPS